VANETTVEILAIRIKAIQRKIEERQEKLIREIVGREGSVTNDYSRGAINAYGNTLVWLRQVVRTDDLYQSFGGS